MLIRNDPFRELDRWSQQFMGSTARPAVMPMDAWRDHDEFVVELDLPGVDPDSIDLDVERNVVMVRAERPQPADHQNDMIAAERPRGVFSRQLVLGESLDTENIRAGYDAGVLVLRIPIAERAKPRKIEIATGTSARTIEAHSSAAGDLAAGGETSNEEQATA
jgi:HSP20 family protein